MRLDGRTVLITGGTSGIGYELARQLLSMKNTVIITGRDREKLDRARHTLQGVHAIQADVSRADDIRALFEQTTRTFPKLDRLINNAGIMRKIVHAFTACLRMLKQMAKPLDLMLK